MENKKITPEGNSREEQNENLRELNYPKSEDIFKKDEKVPLDKNGLPLNQKNKTDTFDMNLDVPGSEYDNKMEQTGNEDEENNYYSISDQD